MNILLLGGIDPNDQNAIHFLESFALELVEHGHRLLGECRNDMDRIIAEQVNKRVAEKGWNVAEYITSYVGADKPPVHQFGRIIRSRIQSWNSLASPGLEVPETIQEADVVIIVSGKEGTKFAANWARIARKPILPLTLFGGAALEIFEEEISQFDQRNRTFLERNEYELLNQFALDVTQIAKDTIALAARAVLSNEVFIIMSFSDNATWDDVADTFHEACSEMGFTAIRVDETQSVGRIVPAIIEGIKNSSFVIADVSEPKPNVYYELGLAQGFGKQIILTAQKGTALPFDINDMPATFWEGQKELKTKVKDKIKLIASRFGR